MTQRVLPILSNNFIADTALPTQPDWAEIFGNENPLALEIGCGTGHFVAERALSHPETNFIAIDIYNKGCLKTCTRIDQAKLDNVRVMRVEARWLLSKWLAMDSLSAVYINCPDPWPKKRHRSRRLVNRDFLINLAHYLKPGGDFYFSSDFDDYAEDVAAHIKGLHGYVNLMGADWVYCLPDYPVSKYMQRFLERDQPIYFIHYQRDPDVPRDNLAAAVSHRGFRAPWRRVGND